MKKYFKLHIFDFIGNTKNIQNKSMSSLNLKKSITNYSY